jgi:glycerol kinase
VPEITAAKQRGTLCCGTVDSWLVYNLTGKFATDYSNAGRTQLLNLRTLNWDPEIVGAFGLNFGCLPEIKMSDSFFGMTDMDGVLPTPAPIHAVMGDSHAALFGNGCREPFMAKATYGTGSSVMMNAGADLPSPAKGVAACVAWGMENRVEYALEGNINYTGAVIRWLVENIGILPDEKSAGIVAQTVTDTGGVYLVPAFTGLGAPYFNSNARAAFTGMGPATTAAHMVRAAEECIAYQIRDVVEAINKGSGRPISVLRVDGGPTRDNFLMQFQSDILNIPVEISHREELSGMGAACCAAIGAGLVRQNEIFSGQTRNRIVPDMDEPTRTKLYSGWKAAVEMLNGRKNHRE